MGRPTREICGTGAQNSCVAKVKETDKNQSAWKVEHEKEQLNSKKVMENQMRGKVDSGSCQGDK